jgi:hypothetical protein
MGATLDDLLAQGRRRRPDPLGVGADFVDRPVLAAAMAGRHMVVHGGVAVIAAHAQMRGDPQRPFRRHRNQLPPEYRQYGFRQEIRLLRP